MSWEHLHKSKYKKLSSATFNINLISFFDTAQVLGSTFNLKPGQVIVRIFK